MIFLLQEAIIRANPYDKKMVEETEKTFLADLFNLSEPITQEEFDKKMAETDLISRVELNYVNTLRKKLNIPKEDAMTLAYEIAGPTYIAIITSVFTLIITGLISYFTHYAIFGAKIISIISTLLPSLIYILLLLKWEIGSLKEDLWHIPKKVRKEAHKITEEFIKKEPANTVYYKVNMIANIYNAVTMEIKQSNILYNGLFTDTFGGIMAPSHVISHLITIVAIPQIVSLILKQSQSLTLAGSIIFLLILNIITGIIASILTTVEYKIQQ